MSSQVNKIHHNVIHRCLLLMLFSVCLIIHIPTVPKWLWCISILFTISQRSLKQHFSPLAGSREDETHTRTDQKSRLTGLRLTSGDAIIIIKVSGLCLLKCGFHICYILHGAWVVVCASGSHAAPIYSLRHFKQFHQSSLTLFTARPHSDMSQETERERTEEGELPLFLYSCIVSVTLTATK